MTDQAKDNQVETEEAVDASETIDDVAAETDEAATVETGDAVETEAQTDDAGDEDTGPQSPEHIRMVEALLFAAAEPLDLCSLESRLPDAVDVKACLAQVQNDYKERGVTLEIFGGKWAFRTASDLAWLMEREKEDQRRLSRAAVETLAIIAYHQPVTRAEIEEIRGVAVSKGTLDVLLETGWVKLRGRRRTPGRPVTYGITDEFLQYFGLESRSDLPGLDELKAAGLLDSRLPTDFTLEPGGETAEEDPLEDDAEGDVSDMLAGTLEADDETDDQPQEDENRE